MEEQLSQKYQQKTDKAHILDNPDTYIGSVEEVDNDMWVMNETQDKIVQKNIRYIPGLYKLFDEGIVNCRDHVIRMHEEIKKNPNAKNQAVTTIEVNIDEATGRISMFNDGNGIDVAKHPENQLWIPEMIFGHLRTSTNYDKTEKKIVGGKNGFGFKLVLIWSTEGTIETFDHIRELKYKQTFRNNLDVIEPPEVCTWKKGKAYTQISFLPDYKRLGVAGLSSDMVSLLVKRIHDIGAVSGTMLKVKYNGQVISGKGFSPYIDMYLGTKDEAPRVYEKTEDGRWEYAVALSPTHEFMQVSFVNGIHTSKGGKHVEYVLNQLLRKLGDFIEKKKKVKVQTNAIKEQLFLFLRCDVENPAFDSQTKDFMNTPSTKFGSSCTVSDKFIEKVAKMGVMDAACALTEIKENKASKKTDGSKTKTIRGIPKLIDANWAGTEKSGNCVLLFCEGDSAKAGIVSGLSSEDRNIMGIYPMKGKILNVRGEPTKKINDNKEIMEIKKILGLETGKTYATPEEIAKHLRYGRVLFVTDADLDGNHIKGLGINLFQSEWPSLCEIPGFLGFMNTPILKARKGTQELLFYNQGEYDAWKQTENHSLTTWNIKYYKGLGTSTGKEFREYFAKKKFVHFQHTGPSSNQCVDMVFNKKRAHDRKDWLEQYDRKAYLNTSHDVVTYEDFIHKELVHFSKYDCDRSIPNIMDGLKISLRKILYSAFKKNLTTEEIKVAQFSGYVSEHSGYHHGEASLNAAIVGLAQNFVGSNNINLFVPSGQFGTRLQGGKDSASERYIFTKLAKLTRFLFPREDDAVLQYLEDDGQMVEPMFYAPILPMVLVNGSKGIGTGFSTEILCYSPLELIDVLQDKLLQDNTVQNTVTTLKTWIPFYEGFQGTIQLLDKQKHKFLVRGLYEHVGEDKIRIKELPVGVWTEDYKIFLEGLLEPPVDKTGKKGTPVIRDYDDMCKDTTVDFLITFPKGKREELEALKIGVEDDDSLEKEGHGPPPCNGLEKVLRLYTTMSTSNMHLFNAKDQLKKYNSVSDIIDDYFEVRLELFQTRKTHLLQGLEKEITELDAKSRFIQACLDGTLDLRGKKKAHVEQELESRGFPLVKESWDYLTQMPMDSVTEEKVSLLNTRCREKQQEHAQITLKTPHQMWSEALNVLKKEYLIYQEDRRYSLDDPTNQTKTKKDSKIKKVSQGKFIVKKV